jgi:uncharacterized protein (DUF305 family)
MKYKFTLGVLLIGMAAFAVTAQEQNAQSPKSGRRGPASPNPEFAASSEKTFDQLMDEAMSVMHSEMHNAARTGDPDRDFVTMMIPHHQGAIDMAKAILLYGKDPQVRRLAQEIITDQESEIQLMQLWLRRHGVNSQIRLRGRLGGKEVLAMSSSL